MSCLKCQINLFIYLYCYLINQIHKKTLFKRTYSILYVFMFCFYKKTKYHAIFDYLYSILHINMIFCSICYLFQKKKNMVVFCILCSVKHTLVKKYTSVYFKKYYCYTNIIYFKRIC